MHWGKRNIGESEHKVLKERRWESVWKLKFLWRYELCRETWNQEEVARIYRGISLELHLTGLHFFGVFILIPVLFFSCLFVCNLMHIWKTIIISSGMEQIYLFISFLLFWHKNKSVWFLNHATDKTDYPKFWSMNKKTVVQQCSPQNHYHYVNERHLKMWTKYSARIPWFLPNVSVDTHWIYILT